MDCKSKQKQVVLHIFMWCCKEENQLEIIHNYILSANVQDQGKLLWQEQCYAMHRIEVLNRD